MNGPDAAAGGPRPPLDMDGVLALSWGFRPAVLLLKAHEMGVFDALAGGWKTPEDVAGRLRADPRATRLLLLGLCGARLLEKSGETFRNSPVVERHFVRGLPDYRGHILDLDNRALSNWVRIPEITVAGEPIPKPEATAGEARAWQETFILAMDAISQRNLENLCGALPVEDGHRLLDIGCGPATYIIELARRFPNLTAVAFDRPNSETIVKDAAARAGVGGRVEFIGGDFTAYKFDQNGPFDGVMLSQIVHILSEEQCVDLLRRASNALKPGGFMAVHEMAIGPDQDPGPAAVFAIQMMLGTKSGGVYSREEIERWLRNVGMEPVLARRTDERSEVIVARKPE